ncbi:TenA family protein [Rhodococcus sp. BGS-1C]|uniref:TenA family protein n=1 Tax=unclassified Rhodococcus (in: high G+C Gram-positive bacteria) TaxID=192944 RepID=UPI00095B1440|nr:MULTISPECIES: TenA family protein [unclassified Rhodococcus (in: high G+C Gram-positive bacteria)]MCC8929893.1 TenA family protein [Rhodococcus sp. I2R]OLT37692.1 TenA family transcriptional regulator [Rhodococcus sp. CUA-806]
MTTPVYSVDPVRYTDRFWESTQSLRAAIDRLEFLTMLGDGTLPLEVFRTYIEQDKLYLAGYAKALSILASRAPDAKTAAFWATSAASAVEEASLHESLLSGDALPAADGHSYHSPACLGYVSYLIAAAATEPYPVAAAAILPCFWVYADVAARLAPAAEDVLRNDPEHPYARWVTTYDSDEFRTIVDGARILVDDAAASATEAQREAMVDAFSVATRYELMFWDSALHPTPWLRDESEVLL